MRYKKIFILLSLVVFLALAQFALAANKNSLPFTPSMPIPGLEITEVDGSTLAKYIVAVYSYGGIFAGAVAMFMLVYAGWEWLLAGGNASKISSARDKINTTLIGLALLFGGYMLLSLISKNLVNFESLDTTLPEMSNICPTITDESTCTRSKCLWVPATAAQLRVNDKILNYCVAPLEASCAAESDLQDVNIPKLTESGCSDCRLTIDTINSLKLAVNMLVLDGERMTITSAYRSLAKQQELYDCYKNRTDEDHCPPGCSSCNEAAKPDCSTAPHLSGKAVDVCLTTNKIDSCQYMKSKYNKCLQGSNDCPDGLHDAMQTLYDVMTGQCFQPYEGEWWHFQRRDNCNTPS